MEAFRLFGYVVDPEWRRRGMGQKLFEEAVVALNSEFPEADLVWGNAEVDALEFWKAIGCEPIGEPFEYRGKPHVVTVYHLGSDSLEERG